MKKFILMLAVLVTLASCGAPQIPQAHEQYLSEQGWQVAKVGETQVDTMVALPQSLVDTYKAAGIDIAFFEQYLHKEVTVSSYTLKEQDKEGNALVIFIYDYNDAIIGNIGRAPGVPLGVFSLADRAKLLADKIIY